MRALHKLSPSQRNMLRAVGSNAMWTPRHSLHAGFCEEEKCSRCGASDGSFSHMVWQCPAAAASRSRLDFLTSAERDSMPECLSRWGIALSVSLAHKGPPWASPPGSDGALP
eukprot:9469573-Alexandrium_andersonii.AAC.1